MKIKLAQYGISHDHASGKARVMTLILAVVLS